MTLKSYEPQPKHLVSQLSFDLVLQDISITNNIVVARHGPRAEAGGKAMDLTGFQVGAQCRLVCTRRVLVYEGLLR